MRTALLTAAVGLASLVSSSARAEPAVTVTAAPAPRRHLVYTELLGKGGPWGLGWEIALTPRLAAGAVASFAIRRDQQLYTVAPYLHATALRGGRHALFGELAVIASHSRIPSPVPRWDGVTDTGAGGQAALGWEWSGPLVVRAHLAITAGAGGVAPWGGLSLGVRL